MNRRQFFRTGASVAGAFALLPAASLLAAGKRAENTRVRIIYSLHSEKQDRPDWPNKGFDFKPHMTRIAAELGKRCKGVEFVTSTASGEEQARKILDEDLRSGGIDGYLVCQMNCWNKVVQTIAGSGMPVLYADFQYGGSGGFLTYNAAFLRTNAGNVGFTASSRITDLAEAAKCFKAAKETDQRANFGAAVAQVRQKGTPGGGKTSVRNDPVKCLSVKECLAQLKTAKVLAISGQESGPAGEIAGVQIERVPFTELNDAWKNADQDETRAVAEGWRKNARKVGGVTRETLNASAAMYLAQRALLKKHGAVGITINCLGGFYGGHIQAYPCLGFHELNNQGLVGACECDVRSAATMVIGTALTQGRPGYISDPVIDTSKRQIIYAHCVASNRVFGPKGHGNVFDILTHSEDRQGASVRSVLPVGYMTTTLEFDQGRKEILFHQGKAVANDADDRACRTKLCAEPVGDIEKLFRMWDQWGWHRVTFYGDLKEPVFALADALGWRVVEEA